MLVFPYIYMSTMEQLLRVNGFIRRYRGSHYKCDLSVVAIWSYVRKMLSGLCFLVVVLSIGVFSCSSLLIFAMTNHVSMNKQ